MNMISYDPKVRLGGPVEMGLSLLREQGRRLQSTVGDQTGGDRYSSTLGPGPHLVVPKCALGRTLIVSIVLGAFKALYTGYSMNSPVGVAYMASRGGSPRLQCSLELNYTPTSLANSCELPSAWGG